MAELKVPEQWGKGLDLGWKEGWTLEMQEYSEELKRLENAAKEGYNPETNTWVSHPSPEDPKGFNDLGYGIKLDHDDTDGNLESEGVIRYGNSYVNNLYYKNLFEHYRTTYNKYNNRSKGKHSAEWPRKWGDLTSGEKIVLLDLQYNTKSAKDGEPDPNSILEKTMKALGAGDHATAQELISNRSWTDKKTGKTHTLKTRNDYIISTYLK